MADVLTPAASWAFPGQTADYSHERTFGEQRDLPRMTTEELLAMPEEEGVDRYLLDGVLWENAVTRRNRWHGATEALTTYWLQDWLFRQPNPKGKVYSGEIGVVLSENPDTTVGIDVAYFDSETIARQTNNSTLVVGVPQLAVEILSPHDTVEAITAKVQKYLDSGVPLVWTINPMQRFVQVHKLGAKLLGFNEDQELIGDPVLPGLRIPVARLFD